MSKCINPYIEAELLNNMFELEQVVREAGSAWYNGGIKIYCHPGYCNDAGDVMQYICTIHVDVLKIFQCVNSDESHYLRLKDSLNSLLMGYGVSVDEFHITRVDYCNNVVVPDTGIRAILFDLIQSCPTKAIHTTREISYDTSLYSSNKSKVINVYDKERERRDKQRMRHDPSFCPKLYEKNVIRLELQIKREHIKYACKRKGMSNNYDSWINSTIEQQYLQNIYKMIPKGDFYNRRIIQDLICNDASLSHTLKRHLLDFISTVSQGGLDAAKEKYSNNTYHRYMNYFATHNISPIPIPDNAGLTYIPSPFVV